MFVQLLKKYGLFAVALGVTVLTVLLSVCTTSILLLIFQGYVDWLGVVVSMLAPSLILPLPLVLFLRMLLKLDEREEEIRQKNNKLEQVLQEVQLLSGLLPICAKCKKIRDDQGYWNEVEGYISKHSEADFTHSICPDCAVELYPGIILPPK